MAECGFIDKPANSDAPSSPILGCTLSTYPDVPCRIFVNSLDLSLMENYVPDEGVTPVAPYTTVFLSQRDLGLTVPINYVTVPGVSLTAACFGHGIYEDRRFRKCLSNLLAAGFKRLVVDVYWDDKRRVWSFCPVAIPSIPSSITSTSISSISTHLSAALSSASLEVRQATDINSKVLNISKTSSSTASLLPSIISLADTLEEGLVKLGLQKCSTSIDLSVLLSTLYEYIYNTENTIGAHLLYLITNLHAAGSASSPESPAPIPTSFPTSSNILSNIFAGNLSAYIYSPDNLYLDRANLNNSFYGVRERARPVEDYYRTTIDAEGIVSTSDGWPSEYYVEFTKSKRLLLQIGSVDPQMTGYNLSQDHGIIFQNGYIEDIQSDVAVASSGDVLQGCFVLNVTDDLPGVNSSWAVVGNVVGFPYPTNNTSTTLAPTLNLTINTINCGISPILNTTLLNLTAYENYLPYRDYSYSTIWSWAPGEPKNFSAAETSLFRCAVTNIDLGGRWTVTDCSQKYYSACRVTGQPLNWTMSSYQTSYSSAAAACPDSYIFATPRNALENSYLTKAIRVAQRESGPSGVWVDFNDLSVQGCWTPGGQNANCPYNGPDPDSQDRTVLVPTIAAIIVLIVSCLTLFVKVAGSRKVRKRRQKRAMNGFVYEGVPS
jgi:hypothetical protein